MYINQIDKYYVPIPPSTTHRKTKEFDNKLYNGDGQPSLDLSPQGTKHLQSELGLISPVNSIPPHKKLKRPAQTIALNQQGMNSPYHFKLIPQRRNNMPEQTTALNWLGLRGCLVASLSLPRLRLGEPQLRRRVFGSMPRLGSPQHGGDSAAEIFATCVAPVFPATPPAAGQRSPGKSPRTWLKSPLLFPHPQFVTSPPPHTVTTPWRRASPESLIDLVEDKLQYLLAGKIPHHRSNHLLHLLSPSAHIHHVRADLGLFNFKKKQQPSTKISGISQ